MHYIVVVEFRSPGEAPNCKIKGLPTPDVNTLTSRISIKNLPEFIEVDCSGEHILNILAGLDIGYRVVDQSMIMEIATVRGRNTKIQKIFWTMAKEEPQFILRQGQ